MKFVAINSSVRGNLNEVFVFDEDLGRVARRTAMIRFVTMGDTDAVDEFRAARKDLEVGTSAVRQQLEARKEAAGDLRKQKTSAYAELTRQAAAEKVYQAKIAEKAATATANEKPSGVIASGAWVCPVQGPVSFSDDWGQPRFGGRSHQGTDMLSARGTPIVAPVSGTVRHQNSSLGGLSFFVSGDDGNTYYGTHTGSYEASGRVTAGAAVGYNGDSGNARGTPHLHFEIQPGGGSPVNPYPTLSKYC